MLRFLRRLASCESRIATAYCKGVRASGTPPWKVIVPLADCRECGHQVSRKAKTCPSCGARKPAREKPPYTLKEWALGCAAVAGGLLFVLYGIGRGVELLEGDPVSHDEAAVDCRNRVLTRFQKPRTAEFSQESVGPTGDGKHDVMGRVSVENDFGHRVQHEYRCILEGEPGDREVDLKYVRPR